MPVLSTRIVLDCFYLLIFYSEKFSTDVCRLPYAVNVNLNLSIGFYSSLQKMKSCDCLLSLKFQFVVPRGRAVLDVPVILKSILRKSTNLRRYKRVFFASL